MTAPATTDPVTATAGSAGPRSPGSWPSSGPSASVVQQVPGIAWIELKLMFREPLTLLVSLGFPVMLLALLAGSFGADADPTFGGIGGVDFYVPIYSAATIAVMGLLGIPTHLASYRQFGVLRRFQASGVTMGAVMAAQVVVMVVLATVGIAAMVLLGVVAYDVSTPAQPLAVGLAYGVGILAFASTGLLLGSLVSTARAAQGLGLLLFFGLFFIAGGGPPPSLLPDAINTFVDWTPMGPLMDAVSDPWHGRGSNLAALSTLAAITVGAGVAAHWRLTRTNA